MDKCRAFTILELLIVVIIVGVLATISISYMSNSRDITLDREAISNLKIIAAAEKVFRLESAANNYIACGNLAAINSNLRLNIPSSPSWNYRVTLTNGFTATAARVGTTTTGHASWNINATQDEPI